MKKIGSLFLAALLGGLSAIGFSKLVDSPQETETVRVSNTAVPEKIQQAASPQALLAKMPIPDITAKTDFTAAAEMTVNAVVHVKTVTMVENEYYSFDPFKDFFFGTPQTYKESKPYQGSGSGVILSNNGYVVTNNHVIDGAEKVSITLNNNKTYSAKVVGTDPSTDLALLKVDATDLPAVSYGNSDQLKIGEWVLAVGNPFNLTSTVTAGIVSAKGRDINILNSNAGNSAPIESFIQTDAAVNPGNSGGALVNTQGQLIGINTAIKSNTGSYTGYSFAIPVNIVRKVVEDLLEFGMVQRGFIGVMIRNVDEDLALKEGIDTRNGVFVTGLTIDGAASMAGIKKGDVIIKVGDIPVNTVPQLQEQVSRFRPGDQLMVTVNRNGEKMVLPVTLRNRNGNTEIIKKENPKISSALGAVFQPVPDEKMKELGITNGVQITQLESGKLRSAGMREGFIITEIDKKPVNSLEDVLEVLENKKGGVLVEGMYPNGMGAYYGFGM